MATNSAKTIILTPDASSSALISPEDVRQNLSSFKILDASWYMPFVQRSPKCEFQVSRIKHSQFFDVDKVSDVNEKSLPHMLPNEKAFAMACDALDIDNDSDVVIYDRADNGIFSAARLWWMFKVFGHGGSVRVLNGGFKAYEKLYSEDANGMDTNEVTTDVVEKSERACVEAYEKGDSVTTKYKAKLDTSRLATAESVKKDVCETNAKQCVDARPKGRFEGTTPEPRAGLACGCIPNSKNVPFPEVLDAETGKFKDAERLKQVFQEAGMELDNQSKKIVATCGTGVTACILTLGMHEVGRDDVEVYDGSWCEWGSRSDVPVKTAAST